MAIQLSTAVRNARLQAIETVIGVSPILVVYSGSMPANVAAATTGTNLATIQLPSDWLAAPAAGSSSMLGNWEDTSADNTGTAGYYRIFASDGVTCHLQGLVTATGGGGDLTVDNTLFAAGQDFKITSYVLNEANG